LAALLTLALACATSVGDGQGGDDTTGGDGHGDDLVTTDISGLDLSGKDQAAPDASGTDAPGVDTPGTDSTVTDLAGDPGNDPGDPDVPALTCHSCHGSEANNAPPVDTSGNSETTAVTVGAHQSHLTQPAGLTVPLACQACHVVPGTIDAPTHMDGSPAELTFGALASTDGATPAWDRNAASCSAVYCHGATLNAGGTNHQPKWTTVDGTQASCGACHGVPPPAPHVQNDDCGQCHTATAEGQTIAHPDKHINGILEVETGNLACNSCHGSADNNAPPVDTKGNSSTTMPSVGAHQAHLTAPHAIALPLACEQCHVVPATVDAAGHLDASPAELTFGALAKTGGANATWTHANASCSTVYCHGATLKGGTVTTPTWTKVDGTQDACGTCHGISPKTGRHPSNFGDHSWMGKDCTNCHNGIANSNGTQITNTTLHVNGVKDVALKSNGTWNAATKSCNPSCHGNENW
jgi:predicted CxxxxCH...CXXCH cytochrome family protein